MTKTATYKGRTYTLLYVGETKFGRRAKLGFPDGSKEFWVPASEIAQGDGGAAKCGKPSSARKRCTVSHGPWEACAGCA